MEDHGEEIGYKQEPYDEGNSCPVGAFKSEQEAIGEVLGVFPHSEVIGHFKSTDIEESELAEAYTRRLSDLASKPILFINGSEKKAILKNRLEGTRYSRSGQRKIMKKLRNRLGHYYYKAGVMLTLTFDIKRFSKCEAWRIVGDEIRRFQNAVNESRSRRRMKKRVSSFKVMEGTDRGYPAPHIVFPGLRWLADVELLNKLWGNGHVWVSFTGSIRPASYACKYISKMGLHDDWLMWMWRWGIRLYSFSGDFRGKKVEKRGGWVCLFHKEVESARAYIRLNCEGFNVDEGKFIKKRSMDGETAVGDA
jgi:hypothetical protein